MKYIYFILLILLSFQAFSKTPSEKMYISTIICNEVQNSESYYGDRQTKVTLRMLETVFKKIGNIVNYEFYENNEIILVAKQFDNLSKKTKVMKIQFDFIENGNESNLVLYKGMIDNKEISSYDLWDAILFPIDKEIEKDLEDENQRIKEQEKIEKINAIKEKFFTSVSEGNIELIKEFLNNDIDINCEDSDGCNALVYAPSIKILNFLFENGAKLGETAIFYAEKPEIAQYFIEKGNDINSVDWEGKTPLMHAAVRGNCEVIKVLLANKADYTKTSFHEGTALIQVSESGNYDQFKKIMNCGLKFSDSLEELICYINLELVDKVKERLAKGVNLNDGICCGDNFPVLKAVKSSNIEILKILINSGANPNAKDSYFGNTALIEAINNNNIEIIKLLIAKNVDVNADDGGEERDYWTPLMYAVHSKNIEIVKILLQNKAKVNIQGKNGETALSIAKEKKDQEIINLLKKAGAKK